MFSDEVYQCPVVARNENQYHRYDGVQISASVRTDNLHLQTVNWLQYHFHCLVMNYISGL